MSYVPMQSKLIGETLTMGFDFQNQMLFGETLDPPLVASVAVTLFSGQDADPSAILSGAVTVSGTTVNTKVTDGMAGVVYALTFHAAGSSGAVYRGVRYLAILSDEGSFVPSSVPVLSGDLPDGIVGAAYSHNLDIAGGYMPYTPATPLPNAPEWMGYTVVDNELVCAGTSSADAQASYTFTARIQDAALTFASSAQTVNLTRTTVAGDLGNMSVGGSPSFSYTASLGTAPYTYSLFAGALPTGLTLNSNGSVTGTATAAGSFSWTVRGLDVNSIPDLHDDSNVVSEFTPMFAAITNRQFLITSTDGGLNWSDTANTGAVASGTNTVDAIGGKMYHWSNTADTTYSTDGTTFPFTAATGLTGFSAGLVAALKPSAETQLYTNNGIDHCYFSLDGAAFTPRNFTSNVVNPVPDPSGNNIVGIQDAGAGFGLSVDSGISFSFYTDAIFNATNGIQRIMYTVGDGTWTAVGRDGSGNLAIAWSATGASGSWTALTPPAVSPYCVGLRVRPSDELVLMVLSDGTVWYSDNFGGSWTAGTSVTLSFPPSFTVVPGVHSSNLYYANGAFFFVANQGVGINRIMRNVDGTGAWTQVYQAPASQNITSIVEFSP